MFQYLTTMYDFLMSIIYTEDDIITEELIYEMFIPLDEVIIDKNDDKVY